MWVQIAIPSQYVWRNWCPWLPPFQTEILMELGNVVSESYNPLTFKPYDTFESFAGVGFHPRYSINTMSNLW